MSRTRATALTLVNWKGVFYERYQLDRHVTVLEGANGAGKTTVMIAAYVVLLPDMSRLRFTNLGESAATGGDRGIHGRLGESGRPSYAALELELASGERLLAGVRLVRGAAPAVDATAFVISHLAADVRLQDLFLVREGEVDLVPELDDIKRAVKECGAAIEVFRSVKDYLSALFERGVTPLRLASEEDRTKLNDMLRTSMTGGISRALTTELRSFLLKEESGLGDTLARMRANLEACRRTRLEVAESRLLEREIRGVYEAGQAMFSAALLSVREAAEDGQKRIELAESARRDAERVLSELAASSEANLSRHTVLEAQLTATRAEITRSLAARELRAARRAARKRVSELAQEVEAQREVANEARALQTLAAEERAAQKQARERAAEAYDRASHGLAHLQSGLDELHRRAHAHRVLTTSLAEASALLGRVIPLDGLASELATLGAEIERLDAARTRLEREVRDADARASDHTRAHAALLQLEGLSPSEVPGSLHERARAVLARLSALDDRVARLVTISRELAEATRLAERQREVRARGTSLGLFDGGHANAFGASARIHARIEELEQSAREASTRARHEEEQARAATARRESLLAERQVLTERAARWTASATRLARMTSWLAQPLASRADVLAARDALSDEQRALSARRDSLVEEREALLRRAAAAQSSGELDPALLRLRDELGAELLASRYEDIDPESAGWLEAKLGPLSCALVVEDLDAALSALERVDHGLPSVWLVRADAGIANADAESSRPLSAAASHVIVQESFGVRVTRSVSTPTLGQLSRERLAQALRASAAAVGETLEALAEQSHELVARRRELDALLDEVDVLALGDPGPECARIEADLLSLSDIEPAHRAHAADARARETEVTAQLPPLLRLLGDANLLDPPDHAARHATLLDEYQTALAARERLDDVRDARRVLAECLEELRVPPKGADELRACVRERDEHARQRDQAARAHAALAHALAHRHAEGWGDAEPAISASTNIAPALEAQHAAAREAVQTSEGKLAAAEAAWERATAVFQAAEAARGAAVAHHERALQELAELGDGTSPAATGLLEADHEADEGDLERALTQAQQRRAELEGEARRLVEEGALSRERTSRAQGELVRARAERDEAEGAARPAAARWQELEKAARDACVLDAVLGSAEARALAVRGSAALAAEARSVRELLLDRLQAARGGAQLAEQLREGHDPLATWLEVRDFLRRRVPAQIAELAEPLDALTRLRDHLDVLEGRLSRQELDLRGSSEDVARGIEVQLRRARGQVRRLNQHLVSVCFGSVSGVRVEMRRVERMEQILRALREGDAQELLFLASMPIEEALDEIFRRHGGGRGGGLRLLDYREYLDLVVEVRRRGGEAWEPTSPTRLSTGEAIGVGAALMMVVLTEWERDSQLLHGRRTGGSLRFLFLDEANRLSRDNLAILFDLCRNLDLQLLVAAPEVARAEGNTTYRLIRRVGEDGREEVIVSGRRALASAASDAANDVSAESSGGEPEHVPQETEVTSEALEPLPTEPAP